MGAGPIGEFLIFSLMNRVLKYFQENNNDTGIHLLPNAKKHSEEISGGRKFVSLMKYSDRVSGLMKYSYGGPGLIKSVEERHIRF
jgi:hypothetical protein